jgi:hypothetical protein
MKGAAIPDQSLRAGSSASLPIWISPSERDSLSRARVIGCPDCLRAFPLVVDAADFVIHEAVCIYCDTLIHYATVQPMKPAIPHDFHAQSARKTPASVEAAAEFAEECAGSST